MSTTSAQELCRHCVHMRLSHSRASKRLPKTGRLQSPTLYSPANADVISLQRHPFIHGPTNGLLPSMLPLPSLASSAGSTSCRFHLDSLSPPTGTCTSSGTGLGPSHESNARGCLIAQPENQKRKLRLEPSAALQDASLASWTTPLPTDELPPTRLPPIAPAAAALLAAALTCRPLPPSAAQLLECTLECDRAACT